MKTSTKPPCGPSRRAASLPSWFWMGPKSYVTHSDLKDLRRSYLEMISNLDKRYTWTEMDIERFLGRVHQATKCIGAYEEQIILYDIHYPKEKDKDYI